MTEEMGRQLLNSDKDFRFLPEFEGLTSEEREIVLTVYEHLVGKNPPLASYFFHTMPQLIENLSSNRKWINLLKWLTNAPWEVGINFVQNLQNIMSFQIDIDSWVEFGFRLANFEEDSAIWFFRRGLIGLPNLSILAKDISAQALALLTHSAGSAVAYIRAISGNHMPNNDFYDLWYKFGLELTQQEPEAGEAYFGATTGLTTKIRSDVLPKIVSVSQKLLVLNRQVGITFLRTSPEWIDFLSNEDSWTYFIARISKMTEKSPKVAVAFLTVLGGSIKTSGYEHVDNWFIPGLRLVELNLEIGLTFFQAIPNVLKEIDSSEVERWVERGLEYSGDEKRLKAFFALSGSGGREALRDVRKGLDYEQIEGQLLTLAEGLVNRRIIIRRAVELPPLLHSQRRHWVTSDGYRVYLPERVNLFADNDNNFLVYKLMLLHKLAHIEAGSYLNAVIPVWLTEHSSNTTPATGSLVEFIACFPDRLFIKNLVCILEDGRAERRMLHRYLGLSRSWRELLSLLARNTVPQEESDILNCLVRWYYPLVEMESLTLPPGTPQERKCWEELYKPTAVFQDVLELAATLYFKLNETESERIKNWSFFEFHGELRPELHLLEHLNAVSLESGNQIDVCEVYPLLLDKQIPEADLNFYRRLRERLSQFQLDEMENTFREIHNYNEWDASIADYRHDWCRVREIVLKPSSARAVYLARSENYGLIESLKKYFAVLRPDRLRRYRRQLDGDDLDIDALVEVMTEIKVGSVSTNDGFYIRRDKRLRDVAAAFLLDLSASTDEVINEQGKTILDVEIESAVIMCEALETIGDQYAVYGFSSSGREKVDFYVAKDFEEAYTENVWQRFGGLRSSNATRLGAAIRHSASKLGKCQAAVKLLFVLSDGRPYDIDYRSNVEPKDMKSFLRFDCEEYAHADVRVALQEAKAQGITLFALTVDRKGKDYLDKIFGQVGYIVVNRVEDLPLRLPEIYRRLTV